MFALLCLSFIKVFIALFKLIHQLAPVCADGCLTSENALGYIILPPSDPWICWSY